MSQLPQKFIAEFVGTFTLIFIGAGSICADQLIKSTGGTGIGLLAIAAAHGLAIAIMVTAIGHISGGHLNPAVTAGIWVTRRINTIEAILYWAAQLLGATAAAWLLSAVIPESVWRPVVLGTPDLAADVTRVPAMVIEAAMTFLLVFVVYATAVDPRGAFNKIAGFAIGLTITMDALLGGPFTGAAINPARAFGPALISHHWANHGVYWVGPLLGGVLAGWIYDRLYLREV
jgi:MIP family channel proteins